jgi:hypothetical protein
MVVDREVSISVSRYVPALYAVRGVHEKQTEYFGGHRLSKGCRTAAAVVLLFSRFAKEEGE